MDVKKIQMLDGNEAASSVAFRTNEVIAIYPITPSSPMGEFADEWAAKGQTNIWNHTPDIMEMQSEAGAISACHGALQAGTLATSFTASQGLLMMIPTLYKIAGELNSFTLHVAARTVATHALSIFGDHSDVMACRQIGLAMLASGSIQEVHDMACISQMATLNSRVSFIHFFDGFRTSHEVSRCQLISDDDLRALIPEKKIEEHRNRALSPDHPVIRGTAQNPDTFFQAREACNPFYLACPDIVKEAMDRFSKQTGRQYNLFDYFGHPQAERVLICMGSGAETAHETVDYLVSKGEKVGLLKVRLFRPFSLQAFIAALPETVEKIAVLDRTKEPGALGEPLYQDVLTAIAEAKLEKGYRLKEDITIVGGRYGLSSKEFTPAMIKAVFDELAKAKPKNHFTVGIVDDVTHLSLGYDSEFNTEPANATRAMFYGLGADGTVGANKNSIKIIGEETDSHAQGYFVYDSKKSGAMTISHLRFGPETIRASYLIENPNFVACHTFEFLEKFDILENIQTNGVLLLNAPFGKDEVWNKLPQKVQERIIEKKLKFFTIDAYQVAKNVGLGSRINTIMQTCFFAISGVLERKYAIEKIKDAIEKTYAKRGPDIVQKNFQAVDDTLAHLHEIAYPAQATSEIPIQPVVPKEAPDFVQRVTSVMMEGKGDLLPVSAFPVDGTYPTGTTQWEKRNVAQDIPVWDADICIQCNKCALVCPHAAIRAKIYEPEQAKGAPATFKSVPFKSTDFKGFSYTIQVAPEDCTGCNLCVAACPAKDKANPRHKSLDMSPQRPLRQQEATNYDFFLKLPDPDRSLIKTDLKGTQFFLPLFEYSGACTGCGETPYVKLMSQLFGDRLLIGNATGCSSIYGGNLPTTPFTKDDQGRGPAWSNSLFENNAEFAFGFRLAVDDLKKQAQELLRKHASLVGDELVTQLLGCAHQNEKEFAEQRERVQILRKKLEKTKTSETARLSLIADYLVKKSVWALGGDGWAYDIGYGGLDHVISTTRDVNILVLDTEVYSNTGGQASKATPMAAAAKFAMGGKSEPKKDLGMIAMTYGHVYVAKIAFGSKDVHTVKAFQEAESYHGPSLILAYSHCIAHGYDLSLGLQQQKMAVDSGMWPLYRFDPRRVAQGQPPLQLDSPTTAKISPMEYMKNETRFRMAEKLNPDRFKQLLKTSQFYAAQRMDIYRQLAGITVQKPKEEDEATSKEARA